jgi:hypothetical protein
MEATCSSGTLDDIQMTTQRYIPQDRTFHNSCCGNRKSYSVSVWGRQLVAAFEEREDTNKEDALIIACFMLVSSFSPDDGDDMSLRNACLISKVCTALYLRS